MAKFKPLNENQLVMLPISLHDQLVPGTLEHTISELVDKHIDLSVFNGRYNNDDTGATSCCYYQIQKHISGHYLMILRSILKFQVQSLMRSAMTQLNLSARGYHRVLKLARTIADLAGSEEIQSMHLAEALQYRPKIMME